MGATNTQEGTLQYTAIGDAVNTASRLCDLAEPGQILISQRTLDQVSGDIETKLVSEMQLKGKQKKVLVFRVTSVTERFTSHEDTDTQH